jgi:ElaB/YqjD/DUF883 family membrane-anchored ribosome-binding protein
MSAQPEALRLADLIRSRHGNDLNDEAAAELRRLHQFAEDQIGRATAAQAALQMTQATHALKLAAVERQRDALLEALKRMASIIDTMGDMPDEFIHPSPWQTLKCEEALTQADAAIAAAEGETK